MATLWPLAADHLLGMLVVMLPFAFLDALIKWQRFDPEWRQPPGDRVRYLAARQPPPASLPMCSFPASTIRDIASQNPQVSISSDLVGSITKIALPQIKHGQMRIVPALVRGTTRSKRGHPSTATTTFRPTAAVQSQRPTSIDADDTVEDSIRRFDPGQPCCHPRSCLPGDGRACHQAARSRSQRR